MVLLILTDSLVDELLKINKKLPIELSELILNQLNKKKQQKQQISISTNNNLNSSIEEKEEEKLGENELAAVEIATIDHNLLIKVHESVKQFKSIEFNQYRISELLKLTSIYAPNLKPREKSIELLSILSKIQLAQDKSTYNSMTSILNPKPISQIPLNDIHDFSTTNLKSELEEWKEVQRQISAIINVLGSMVAVGVAVWWVGGGRSIGMRLALSFSGSLTIASIETFLYMRMFSNKNDDNNSKDKKKILRFEDMKRLNERIDIRG